MDVEGGRDLVPVTLWDAHKDSIFDIANKANQMVQISKQRQNKEHNEMTKIALLLPTYLLGLIGTVASYISQNAGISIPAMGVSLDYFHYDR